MLCYAAWNIAIRLVRNYNIYMKQINIRMIRFIPILPVIFLLLNNSNQGLKKNCDDCETKYYDGSIVTEQISANCNRVINAEVNNPWYIFDNFKNKNFPFAESYFKNLKSNMPINILGNCGYTSIGMLMSFYDTFINDSIIPENFEVKSFASYETFLNPESDCQSPGVWELSAKNGGYLSSGNIDELLAKEFDLEADIETVEYKERQEFYYLCELQKYMDSKSFLGYLFKIALDSHILKTSSDNQFNEILQNRNTTFLEGVNVGYNIMIALLTKYINNNHFLSSHIVTIDFYHISERSDSEYARVRAELVNYLKRGIPVIVGGHKMDNSGGHFCVSYAYDDETDSIILNWGWQGNRNMINADLYMPCIEDFICLDFGNLLEHDCTHNYDFCPCGNQFNKHLIRESDYGFEQQYFYYEKEKEHVVDGLVFSTKRLRCGYIEQERINLSPRRANAGTSFLQFQFPSANVQCISLDLSFWSVFEGLDSTNGSVLIQYASVESNWITAIDLLNDFKLSTNRYQHDTLSFSFYHTAIHYFRIIATSANISSSESRNKGRISIKNVNIYTLD